MRQISRRYRPVDEENPYWMSFSDIMSALLMIFILAAIVLMLQLAEEKDNFKEEVDNLKKAEEVRKSILEEALEALKARGIEATVSENDTVLSISSETLGFDSGEYEIQPRFEPVAREIGQVISEVIRRGERYTYLDTVFVEGHTDKRAYYNGIIKSNWELSAFRAISLWRLWGDELSGQESLKDLRNLDGKPLFSVSGYAATRPADQSSAMNSEEEELKRHRRIDIRFTIRRPTSEDYQRLLEDKPEVE